MLERLGMQARSAVTRAGIEAKSLGHHHIGTEHLLLGLLAEGDTPASAALTAAGASLVPAREKVLEALASRTTPSLDRAGEDLPFTDRAGRALDRASKLSLRLGRDQVGCEHILVSVLDVEGTAGQVLRGLGVDPQAVRQALMSSPSAPQSPEKLSQDSREGEGGPLEADPQPEAAPNLSGPLCSTCGSPVAISLDRMTISVGSGSVAPGHSVGQVHVFYCTVCRTTLGVAPA
ncbi:MAG: hypothetical protein JO337_05525 [Acidimicrobiales bacterium]|nr:hypothetical protein [Acidimicrobiales bacterium]